MLEGRKEIELQARGGSGRKGEAPALCAASNRITHILAWNVVVGKDVVCRSSCLTCIFNLSAARICTAKLPMSMRLYQVPKLFGYDMCRERAKSERVRSERDAGTSNDRHREKERPRRDHVDDVYGECRHSSSAA